MRRDRCHGKVRHPTEAAAAARLVATDTGRCPDRPLVAYRCHDCGGWHLGHAPASDWKIRTRARQLARAGWPATIGDYVALQRERGAA